MQAHENGQPPDEVKREDQEALWKSYFKEQAKYWKAFVSDLFFGTLKRMTYSFALCV